MAASVGVLESGGSVGGVESVGSASVFDKTRLIKMISQQNP